MDEDLLRYLNAKFEGVETRISGLQALWQEETTRCADERLDLSARVHKLERWRDYLVGGVAIIAFLLSGITGMLERLFGIPTPK